MCQGEGMCLWCVENMDSWWCLAKMLLTGALASCFLGNLLHFALTCTEKYVMAVGRICTVLSILLTSQLLFPWADSFFFFQTLWAQTFKCLPTCRMSSNFVLRKELAMGVRTCNPQMTWCPGIQSTVSLAGIAQGEFLCVSENRICPSSVCCWGTSAFV